MKFIYISPRLCQRAFPKSQVFLREGVVGGNVGGRVDERVVETAAVADGDVETVLGVVVRVDLQVVDDGLERVHPEGVERGSGLEGAAHVEVEGEDAGGVIGEYHNVAGHEFVLLLYGRHALVLHSLQEFYMLPPQVSYGSQGLGGEEDQPVQLHLGRPFGYVRHVGRFFARLWGQIRQYDKVGVAHLDVLRLLQSLYHVRYPLPVVSVPLFVHVLLHLLTPVRLWSIHDKDEV